MSDRAPSPCVWVRGVLRRGWPLPEAGEAGGGGWWLSQPPGAGVGGEAGAQGSEGGGEECGVPESAADMQKPGEQDHCF